MATKNGSLFQSFLFFAPAPEKRKSEITEAQIAFMLKQVEDGTSISEICRKAGISQATYFKYAGLMPSEMKRLRELEDENARLKRIVAGLTLDREMLQDVIKRSVWFAPRVQVSS